MESSFSDKNTHFHRNQLCALNLYLGTIWNVELSVDFSTLDIRQLFWLVLHTNKSQSTIKSAALS